jgi:hypothetical protein
MLDQLKSKHIPSLYPDGKRCIVGVEGSTGKTRVTIYLNQETVTVNQPKDILHQWNIDIQDAESE